MKKRIGDIVAFCVGCLFVLLIFLSIEIVFRSVKKDIKPTRISITPFIECTEQGKKVLPNIKGEEKVIVGEKSQSYLFETDKKGRRVTPQIDNVDKNINCLFLGCSFTFGTGVNDDQTMPFYFAQLHPDCKVYNYGITGGSPQELYLQTCNYENFDDIEKKPTIVIYTFIPDHMKRLKGTISMVFKNPRWGGCIPLLEIVNGEIMYKGRFSETRPYLFFFGNYLGKSLLVRELFSYAKIDFPYPYNNTDYDFLITLLNKSNENLSSYFPISNFVVFIHPTTYYLNFSRLNIDYFVKQLKEQEKITLVSWDDKVFQKLTQLYSSGENRLLDGHPIPDCHKLCAEWISKDLIRRGIIK